MKMIRKKGKLITRLKNTAAIIILLLIEALFSIQATAQTPDGLTPQSETPTGTFKIETIMVPMRDSVKLATDVYLPGGPQKKMPALLMRTPYGKVIGGVLATTILSKRYAWIVQDTRGRHDSEGVSQSFLDDTKDGYDTVEWIAAQPWSNGDVGTIGISAMGISQYVMAAEPSKHLKSQYVMAAAGSLYHDAAFIGGGFRRGLVLGWVGGNRFPIEFLELLLKNPNYNRLWTPVNLHEHLKNINYPILHMGGWYDIFLEGNIRAFQDIQKNGAPGAKGRQRLILGPWTHMGWSGLIGTKQGALNYPPISKYNIFMNSMKWFDETMRGKDNGIMSGPAVRYYVLGDPEDPDAPGNEWRTADTWPPYDTATPYYFHSDGTLSPDIPATSVGEYRIKLRPTKNRIERTLSFISDPANPVPTIGGALLVQPNPGPADQRPTESRDDVLSFSTPVLSAPLEVTGPLKAILYVSTDVPDTDFAVKLTDVYPDGRSMLVADGLIRASHRDGSDHRAKDLKPGKIYKLIVDVTDTSIIFNKGHRIRVDIAGSNFPRFDINLNNGKFFDFEKGELRKAGESDIDKYINKPDISPDARIAHNKLYVDAEHPSHFLLPVIK